MKAVVEKGNVFPTRPAVITLNPAKGIAVKRVSGDRDVADRGWYGAIGDVEIESMAGGEVRPVNPWPGHTVRVAAQEEIRHRETNGVLSFSTKVGGRYSIKRK